MSPETQGVIRSPAEASRAKTARVAVLGATGYAGGEFVRLALAHPGITIDSLVLRSPEQSLEDALPGLDAGALDGGGPERIGYDALEERIARGGVDMLVVALPHGAWSALCGERPTLAATAAPLRVLDLSSDHRDGSAGYVYGLPEAFREEIRAAQRVANPGCYPTAAALALMPAAAAGWIDGPVTVQALSGVTGAGRAANLATSFVELDGGASFYKVGTVHAHVSEMARTITRLARGRAAEVAFVPQLVPMARGILLTAQCRLARAVSPDEARAAYALAYADEPFVRMLPGEAWPKTRAVRGSNRVDVQVTTVFDDGTLIATVAIDNLSKGAGSQALQNLNLMLDWPETTGLSPHGRPW
ncbi:MAG: N-acetyl-gamma-glutamyl-phosphate reductase [Candidatus Eisenbacteria bacterium]